MKESYNAVSKNFLNRKKKFLKRNFTIAELDIISWERLEKYIEKMSEQISEYLYSNQLKIKYIVPILRSGLIPATLLSQKLHIIDFLPIQIKYNYEKNIIDKRLDFNLYKGISLKDDECILLIEDKHVTGRTANIAKEMILEVLPNAKIIYVTITRDYFFKDSVSNIIFNVTGLYTNAAMKLAENECKELGIDFYILDTVNPWENIEEKIENLKQITNFHSN